MLTRLVACCLRLSIAAALSVGTATAYSQFTHLELVDLVWTDSIRPLLLQRYPGTTEAQLRHAHGYAYGGCLIQDIGYYPFGKQLFSDLTHYVRTGDFVLTLIRNARDVNEFAFAIGALSHYVGDSIGHAEATNRATPITFPDLAKEYGSIVTYEEAPTAHVRTEFGFDVAQTAWQRYAPRGYRKSLGLHVSRPLLYRSFRETYGVRTRGILGPARAAVETYHWSVAKLLPLFLRAEIVILRSSLPQEDDTAARREFLEDLDKASYAGQPGYPRSQPGFGAHVVAILIRIIPKVGALKILSVKPPGTETDSLFLESAVDATRRYRELLNRIASQPNPGLQLEDLDLDTGRRAVPGDSKIVDRTFAQLLAEILKQEMPPPAETVERLLEFLGDGSRPLLLSREERRKVREEVQALRNRYRPPATQAVLSR